MPGQQNTNGLEATLRVSPIHNVEKGIQWTVSLNARTYKSEYANIGNSLSALNKAGQASVTGTTRYYDGGSRRLFGLSVRRVLTRLRVKSFLLRKTVVIRSIMM